MYSSILDGLPPPHECREADYLELVLLHAREGAARAKAMTPAEVDLMVQDKEAAEWHRLITEYDEVALAKSACERFHARKGGVINIRLHIPLDPCNDEK